MQGDRRVAGVILLGALLEAAEPLAFRPSADFLTSIEACLASEKDGGSINEHTFLNGGWSRKTSDEDERGSGLRTYVRTDAAPIYLSLHSDYGSACDVEADRLVTGGQSAMLVALVDKFGEPAQTMNGQPNGVTLRFWHLPHHSILYASSVRAKAPFSFTVTYVDHYPGTNTK